MGKKKTKFYHVSPYRIKVGEIITNPEGLVYFTTSPVPHYTIAPEILTSRKQWHVYEVEPIGLIEMGEWEDLRAPRAQVVRYVGNARGILEKFLAKKPNGGWLGSMVRGRAIYGRRVKRRHRRHPDVLRRLG